MLDELENVFTLVRGFVEAEFGFAGFIEIPEVNHPAMRHGL